jgi:FMN reductase
MISNAPGEKIRIVALSGNPRPQSRTHALAVTLATELANVLPAAVGRLSGQESTAEVTEIELADLGPRVLDPDDPAAKAAFEEMLAGDVLIISSPTYKATYSGLLKSFLDRCEYRGLTGRTAVPIMLARLPGHELAVNLYFATLLLELDAKVPAGGLYVLESDVEDFRSFAAAWAAANAVTLVTASRVADRVTGAVASRATAR